MNRYLFKNTTLLLSTFFYIATAEAQVADSTIYTVDAGEAYSDIRPGLY
jgi:hypothetical protein